MTTPTIRDVRTQGQELELPAIPEAVRVARRFVTDTLQGWHVADAAVEAAELVMSELTTNAIERSQLLMPWVPEGLESRPPDAAVWVRVYLDNHDVIVEVWDRDPTPPAAQEPNAQTEHGRGLLLVARLSERWGYYWPPAGGKIVWARIGHDLKAKGGT